MSLRITANEHDGVVVLGPSGLLDVTSYPLMRDTLLKHSAEVPDAIVVDLAGLDARHVSPLSVFPTVGLRIAVWPDIPMLLAAPGPELAAVLSRSSLARFVPLHDTVADALAAVHVGPRRRRATWTLPLSSGAPGQARAWLGLQCARWRTVVTPAMTLIVSELVTIVMRNAISIVLTLRIELRSDGLSIAVHDDDTRPLLQPVEGPGAAGHGINLVNVVSRAWGRGPRLGGGRVIWAVAALDGGPAGPIDVRGQDSSDPDPDDEQ